MTSPRVISLDIESYGACHANSEGKLLPEQKLFNPLRSMHTDGVTRDDLVLTVAITLPEYDPRCNSSFPDSKTTITNSTSTSKTKSVTDSNKSQTSSCQEQTRQDSAPWSCSTLAALSPATSMVFQMSVESHRTLLRKWLQHSNTILGMNLQFDIQYLRQLPDFRFVLDGRQTLIDLSVVNYIHNELRPEKSLKSLGPVLGTHTYEQTIKDGRFKSPKDAEIISYNAQDTHNTMLCVSELAKRILKDQPCPTNTQSISSIETLPSPSTSTEKVSDSEPRTSSSASRKSSLTLSSGPSPSVETTQSSTSCLPPPSTSASSLSTSSHSQLALCPKTLMKSLAETKESKLSPQSIEHYSDTIWSCITMSESGIPMSFDLLNKQLKNLTFKCEIAARVSKSKYNLVLEGTGSAKSKQEFIDEIIEEIDSHSSIDILSHPLLSLTPKTKKISWSEDNRNLLSSYLPKDHRLQSAIRVVKYHASAQKLISTYLYPLLKHRRNRPQDKSSVLIPFSKEIGLAHPTWYIVPSLPKDTGSEGGTIQGRITCKSPSAQTFPPPIKKAMKSRWTNGSIIGFDLSQIELRVAALLSGDDKLIQSFTEGLDLHTDRTVSVFGEDIQSDPAFKSKWRQIGKTLNFADLFLASASRMQRTVVEMCGDLMPIPFFNNIVKTRYLQRPGLCSWQYELACVAETQGTLVLPITGQSRTFTSFEVDHTKWDRNRIVAPVYNKNFKSLLNEVVNFPIQTTAGNVLLQIQHNLNRMMGSMNRVGRRPLMFLQVYDAVYFDCPTEQVSDLEEMISNAVDLVVHGGGYWNQLQQIFQRTVPVLYEVEQVS